MALLISNFTGLSLAQSPTTDSIKVDIKQVSGFTKAVYTITQDFPTNKNRGIFIALPYTSDGVKIDYNISELTRNDQPEKFQVLNDMFNFRVRFGDPNVHLKRVSMFIGL